MTLGQARSLTLLVLATLAYGSLWNVPMGATPPAPAARTATERTNNKPAATAREVAPSTSAAREAEPRKELLTGRVVLLADAFQTRKIKSYPEEIRGQIVLETSRGELFPIVPDWRGRAFFQDSRLRDRKVTLLVHRRESLSYLQVLSIFTYDADDRPQLTDYWCDICAIPMYEIKKCECCQGPTRLRFQRKPLPVLPHGPASTP